MGLFGFGKERGIVDLGERYRRQKQKAAEIKKEAEQEKSKSQESSGGFFPFFGAVDNSSSTPEVPSTNIENSGIDNAERRKRLAKRLKDMTDRIEDMSNQIYRLQQRVEVLERKEKVGY